MSCRWIPDASPRRSPANAHNAMYDRILGSDAA